MPAIGCDPHPPKEGTPADPGVHRDRSLERQVVPLPAGANGRAGEECQRNAEAHEPGGKTHVELLGGVGGRLLIGTRTIDALPSEGDQDEEATGSSNVNVEPAPGSDSTQIWPCIRSTSS